MCLFGVLILSCEFSLWFDLIILMKFFILLSYHCLCESHFYLIQMFSKDEVSLSTIRGSPARKRPWSWGERWASLPTFYSAVHTDTSSLGPCTATSWFSLSPRAYKQEKTSLCFCDDVTFPLVLQCGCLISGCTAGKP